MKGTKGHPITKQMVWKAYKKVRANKGSAGIDGTSLEKFEADLSKNLYKIWNRLASGSYFPPPVKEVGIPKKDGNTRYLGIPTVGDRVAQMVVKDHLEPELDPKFDTSSYGYRENKSAHDALERARRNCLKYDWVIDLDIKGFFDNINHELLMLALKKHTHEKWVLMYIERWLQVPIHTKGGIKQRDRGTPQGGVISPLLANLFLHYAFDKWIRKTQPTVEFERYADDIIVHCKTKDEAERIMVEIEKRLSECKLELHPEKTKMVYCKDSNRKEEYSEIKFTFLGYTFQPRLSVNRTGKGFLNFSPAISEGAKKNITESINELRIHKKTESKIEDLAMELNPKLRGWINYYGKFRKSALYQIFYALNKRLIKWVRKRYKKLTTSIGKAIGLLRRIYKTNPKMFAHWNLVRP